MGGSKGASGKSLFCSVLRGKQHAIEYQIQALLIKIFIVSYKAIIESR